MKIAVGLSSCRIEYEEVPDKKIAVGLSSRRTE